VEDTTILKVLDKLKTKQDIKFPENE